jgi:SAM-dependent methyltransferase
VERAGEYVLHHCPGCDLVFSEPMRGGDAEWYDGAYFVLHVAVDDRLREYGAWALRNLPGRGRLLDVGCGTGAFVHYATARGFDACGIDFSHKSVEAGRRRFGLRTLVARPLADFREEQAGRPFDVVTSFEVLEHVESPRAFLADIHALLGPGGLVVLSVPNRGRWPVRGLFDSPPHHLTRWTERALRTLLELSGFDVVRMERTPVPGSIKRFIGAGPKLLLRAVFNRYGRRGRGTGGPASALPRPLVDRLGRVGSTARRWMDAALWVPTVVTLPLLYPWFEGYNLVVLARKKA